MPNYAKFIFIFIKVTLIILNSFIIGASLLTLIVGGIVLFSSGYHFTLHENGFLIICIIIVGINYVSAVIGVIRENRVTVLTTFFITLILLLRSIISLAVSSSLEYVEIVLLLYFLLIVILSLAYAAMIKERQLCMDPRHPQMMRTLRAPHYLYNFEPTATNSGRFSSVVFDFSTVGDDFNRSEATSSLMADSAHSALFKDPPPPYALPTPPPKYDDIVDGQ